MRALTMALVACGFAASAARAAPPQTMTPEACASHARFHREPIYPREVVMLTSGDPVSTVSMIVCFASRERRIGDLYVKGAALANSGAIAGADGQHIGDCQAAGPDAVGCGANFVGDIRRTRGRGFARPGIIGMAAFTFQVYLPAGRKLARKALVSFQWMPCSRERADGSCQPGLQRTDTFLIPARLEVARPNR